jgi:hemerythrin-like domain-containing protein
MADVITLLNQDHREVEQLFAEFRSTQDPAVVDQICEELTVHAAVEEEVVYPVLKRIDADLEQEAEEEHDQAKQLIVQIQSLTTGDPQLGELIRQLEDAVQHHVQEEEDEAWPKLREGAGDQLDDLGARVEQRKQELLQAGVDLGADDPAAAAGSAGGSVPEDATKEELYERAKEAGVEGRSTMDKDELREAVEGQG